MHYIGTITNLLKEELVGANQLRKRSVVVEEITDRDYKGSIVVDFYKEKCDVLNNFKVGDTVKVWLNFRANEYNWKWYNSVSWWSINAESSSTPNATPPKNSYEDDLPF